MARRGSTSAAATTKITIRPHDALALIARMSIGAIFFLSGHTRVEGWLTVTDGTYTLFRDEYKLPLIPVEIAAHAAVWAEHLFPLLLLLGLSTRLSALALLGRRGFIRVDARRLGIGMGCKAVFAANIVIFAGISIALKLVNHGRNVCAACRRPRRTFDEVSIKGQEIFTPMA